MSALLTHFLSGCFRFSAGQYIHVDPSTKVDDADVKVTAVAQRVKLRFRFLAGAVGLPDINYVEGKGSDGQTTLKIRCRQESTRSPSSRACIMIFMAKAVVQLQMTIDHESVQVDGSNEERLISR